MTHDDIVQFFTRESGDFVFARWGRPISPVIFGVTEDSLPILKGAIEAVVALAGHKMAETDPELGANLMVFFVRDWSELIETPNLDRLVPDLDPLVAKLEEAGANQYRIFRFDADGGIKAAFVFLRMDGDMQSVGADTLALAQMVQTMVLWSNTAFRSSSPILALPEGRGSVLRPEIAALLRAAYDPVLPNASDDASLALRLAARLEAPQ
ncbi:MAG: hypothetical protein AAGF74_17190 [Pseudomonadota bacterium]